MNLHRKALRHLPILLLGTVPAMAAAGAAQGIALPAGIAPLPSGLSVISGQASVTSQGHAMQIVNTPNTILDWQSFSIGAGYSVNFQQASAQSQVVNRVSSQNPSYLLGALSSNGRVWLLNPNGILFGQNARVDVGSLIASTLRLDTSALDSGHYALGADARSAAGLGIVNQGLLSTPYGGQLLLIGPSIRNEGTLQAPGGQIGLLAADSVELLDTGLPYLSFHIPLPQGEVHNTGSLLASGIDVYGGVINQQGLVQADQLSLDAQGRIVLSASRQLTVAGRVDASNAQGRGGSIALLGAGNIDIQSGARLDVSGRDGGGRIRSELPATLRIAPGASLFADGGRYGNGGSIQLWSLDLTQVYGQLSARGGSLRGDGGFIETSSHGQLLIGRAPDASAAHGRAGLWLLDPQDVDIDDYLASDIIYALEGGTSVEISTSPCADCEDPGQLGDITLSSPINVSLGASVRLSLIADHSIYLNQAISASGATLDLSLQSARNGDGLSALGSSVNLNGGTLHLSGELDLRSGSEISNALISGTSGASIWLDRYSSASFDAVTLGPDITMTLDAASTLNIRHDLLLDGAVLRLSTFGIVDEGISPGATLHFSSGVQFLAGNGTLLAGNYGSGNSAYLGVIDADDGFRIGAGIVLSHTAGDLYLDHLLSNHGLINSQIFDPDFGTLYINADSSGSWSNTGEIRANGSGSSIKLYGSWSNSGVFNANQGVIVFGSDISGTNLGTMRHGDTGHFVLDTGISWNLQGGSFDLDGMGRLELAGGFCEGSCPSTLRNGTLFSSNGQARLDLGHQTVLDGMTLGAGLQSTLANGGGLDVQNGLRLDGSLSALTNSVLNIHGGLTVNGTLSLASNVYSELDHGARLILIGDATQHLQGSGQIIARAIADPDAEDPAQAGGATISTQAQSADRDAPRLDIGSGLQISSQEHVLTLASLGSNQGQLSADGGRLELSGDDWQNDAGGSLGASAGVLDISGLSRNAGSILASGGSVVVHDPGAAGLSNSGLVSAQGGDISLANLGSNSGTLAASAGTLTVDGNSAGLSSSGSIDVSGGTLHLTKLGSNSGLLQLSAGSLEISASSWNQEDSAQLLVSGGSAQLGGLDHNAGSISLSGGTLELGGLRQNSGSIDVSGGKLTLTGADTGLSNTGSLSGRGGTLSLGNFLSNSGTLALSGGTLNLSGSNWHNDSGGQIVVSGGLAQLEGLSANSGVLSSSGSGSLQVQDLASNSGSLLASGGQLSVSGASGSGLINTGDVSVTGGQLSLANFSRNSARLSLGAGTLEVSGDGWRNASGAQILITGGTAHLDGFASNNGSLSQSGGQLTIQDMRVNSGSLISSGGTLDLRGSSSGGLLNTGQVSLTGGTLDITNFAANQGSLQISSGSLDVSGSWQNQASGQVAVTGGDAQLSGISGNAGRVTVSGGTLLARDLATNSGSLSASGGQLTVDGASTGLHNSGSLSAGGGSVTLSRFSTNSGTLSVSAGSLDVGGSAWQNQDGGQVLVSGGSAQLSGISSNAGTVELSGGALTASGASNTGLSNSGSIQVRGGSVTLTRFSANSGTLDISSGSLDVGGSGWQNQDGGEVLVSGGSAQLSGIDGNAGSVAVNGGTLLVNDLTRNSGSLNASGGQLTVNGATAGLDNSGSIKASGGTVSLTNFGGNSGTLDISSGSLDVSGSSWHNTDGAQVSVTGGSAQLSGIAGNAGSVDVRGGVLLVNDLARNSGSLSASSGQLTVNGATARLDNSGSVNADGGTVSLTNFGGNSGTLNVSSGSLDVSGSSWHNADGAQVSVAGGSAQLSGIAGNAGSVDVRGGTLVVNDLARNSGSLNASGGQLTVNGATTGLDNSGSVNAAGGTMLLTNFGGNSGTLNVSSGWLDISGSAWQNQDGGQVLISGGSAQLSGISSNAGSVDVSGGHLSVNGITAGLNNSGSISTSGGALALTNFGGNSGMLNVSSGSLDISGSAWQNQDGGQVLVSGGSAQLSGIDGNAGSVDVRGGVLLVNDLARNSGSLNASGGQLSVNGATAGLANSGSINTSGAAVTLTNFSSNSGTLNVSSGSLDVSGSSWQNEDSGRISVSGGSAQLAGIAGNAGSIELSGGSLAIADVSSSAGITVAKAGGAGWSNAAGGTLTVSAGTAQFSGLRQNAGTMDLQGGSTTLADAGSGGLSNTGLIRLGNSATLVAAEGLRNDSGGVIRGDGRIDLSGALLRNQGLIAPEDGGGGVATLQLLGDYQQLAGGVLAIDVAGAGLQDQLGLSGQATLAGTLQLSFASGYSAASGDSFTVMRYAGHSGSFDLQSSDSSVQQRYQNDQLQLSKISSVPDGGLPQVLSRQLSKPMPARDSGGDSGLVNATQGSTLSALFTQAGVSGDSRVTPQSYLLTDGEQTYFRNISVQELPREQVSKLLSARTAFKAAVLAEARAQLEENPQLADLPQCQSLQEAEKGVCILSEDLQKQLLKKRRQAPAARLQMVAAVPAIARKRALVIGLNHYADPRVPQLSSAVPDARAIAGELQSRLGYEVLALENPDRAQIVAALNRLTLEMREDDSLLVYFAGHGELVEKTGLGYWIPSDASARDPRGWISNADVARWLRLMQAKQVALILDSCYSGSFVGTARKQESTAQREREAQSYLGQRSVMAMTSGSDEPVADSGNNGHSVFAWSLLQQLRRLDRWAPGNTLFFQVRDEVERELPQTPQYGNALADSGSADADFLFERRSLLP
ncbi:filamentous hemagglutinin family N-terminal domain-containing protein [Solimonas aquatica]|uniref:Filamentous hemagglutinin family N-terminal domain-containing protein n=1 Tax=Solimonas aquatica TaxID=489703 RepID=A0A1H9L660_9GAMM|nr:caspase family protein [Solimonas aquatica]SER06906.1 filamentous hemagglutinin family N-terminal domain-containing protein [Solimonas aquatica]